MKNITKNIFLNAIVCPTLGWLLRSGRSIEELTGKELTLGEQFRIEQGTEVHKRARQLFPGGVLVDPGDLKGAISETESLIANSDTSIIYESTFNVDAYIAKADIIRRFIDGWHLLEIKSSANDKDKFIDDMAYTTMVIKHRGFDVKNISLVLISKDYRLGMDERKLFVEINHTEDVLERVGQFEPFWDVINQLTKAPIQPDPNLRKECKECPVFDQCLGSDIENHIFDIPRLHQTKFDRLKELGIVRIEDIPKDFPLTDNQVRVRDCVVVGQPYISSQLKNDLDAIIWPASYLDFETVMTAIPLYTDIAPYTQMPTQYSIHKCSDVGKVVAHKEFLSDYKKDDRRRLAETLISDLETAGSIITYSNFEQNTINNLARLYPDLSDKLEGTLDRIVDLEAIIRKNFYHPDFHGSISIKRVLPVLVSTMSYDDLEISDGDSASAAFAYLALGRWKEESEVESIRDNLKHYCARDTLAMVKLHERLHTWE